MANPKQSLTEKQRKVLETFRFSWTVLTQKEIREAIQGKVSLKTVRRALAKLCRMGLIERMPATRPGRGYTHQYRLARGRDKGNKEDKKEEEEVIDKDNPLAELNDLLEKFRKETQV